MPSPAPFDLDAAAWLTLRGLLDDALALPPANRRAWVDALGAEHDALKPQLQQLLAHADAHDDPIGPNGEPGTPAALTLPRLSPPLEDAQPGASHPVDGQDGPAPPPAIGPYRPMRLIGEGGMGRVWLAERIDIMRGRPVALKLPHAAWRHAGLAERMAREREILAVLDHPHIARLIDAGVSEDGQPYLALAYVEGDRIDTHCRQKNLAPRERVALFLQVVEAVAHAHGRLVVHRDLKPANILVTAEGEVRLLDFGIARLLGPQPAGEPGLTEHGGRLLTPHYAAPEQIRGEPVGTATDVYALGVVLFELLTGRTPYRVPRESRAALEDAILNDDPPKPSACVADRRLRRALRGDLDTIVAKAMKKAPAERYATANALADDLARWLAQRPVLARPDSVRYRLLRFLQRHRLGAALTAGIAVALCVGLAHTLWQAEQVRREAAKAGAVRHFLVSLFEASDVDQRDGVQRRQQSVQQLLEQSARELGSGTGLAQQPELRSELQGLVARLLRDLGLIDSANQLRRQRSELLARTDAAPALRTQALRELAQTQRDNAAWADSRNTLLQASELCATARLQRSTGCLGVSVDLADVDTAERRIAPALARLEPLLPALRSAVSSREPGSATELAAALELLGLLRGLGNQPEAAYTLLQEALAMRRAEWGAESVRLANMRYRLGRNLWAMRYMAPAEAELRAASATFDRAYGPGHLRSARVALSLGRLVFYVGLQPDGLATIRQASDAILLKAAEVDAAVLLDTRVVLANALLLDGRLAEAGAALQAALSLRAGLGEAAFADPTLDQSQARYLVDTGRYAEARAGLEQTRARAIARYGAGHPDTADLALRIAAAWIAEGRLAPAQREIDAALASQDEREAVFGSAKHKAVLAQVNLLLAQGRFAEARPMIESSWAEASKLPRSNQYRDVLHGLHEQMARTLAGVGETARAAQHFRQAIELLAPGNPDHPHLAATRARYAGVLLAEKDRTGAARELALAERALQAQPQAGDQFRQPLRSARTHMAGSACCIASSPR